MRISFVKEVLESGVSNSLELSGVMEEGREREGSGWLRAEDEDRSDRSDWF
jgi:hypothetical protein